MYWKEFFNLTVMRNGNDGKRPYFSSTLQVPDLFSIDDLCLTKFEHLNLPENEKRNLTLSLRKIILSHHYFNSMEFERIFLNFFDRLIHEKSQDLNFSTQGGGIHLFLAALKANDSRLREKRITCTTHEPLLPMIKAPPIHTGNLHFIYEPVGKNFFGSLPSLWRHPELKILFKSYVA
jgi:hypothetical protein